MLVLYSHCWQVSYDLCSEVVNLSIPEYVGVSVILHGIP